MRFVRYTLGQSAPAFGWLIEDRIGPLDGSPFGSYRRQEATIPLSSVRLLAPVMPGKIICIGRNYVEHAREHNAEVPETPLLFLKPPSSVIGPGDKIILPPQSQQVEHEGELAVVIGRRGRWIPMEQALDYVLGYTIG
ncbi:MAG TPA: fumarylacetoacetate hydrolase family protein, partial [Anaerolineaceae bacterium]|nr:fumarylacetoacetate hydrolase family protein [Anaerolineaceae bacterium]